jgi:hypothetical protein
MGIKRNEKPHGRAAQNCVGSYVFPSSELDVNEAVQFLKDSFLNTLVNAVVLAVYEDDAIALLNAMKDSGDEFLNGVTLIFTDSATTPKAISVDRYYRFTQSFYGFRPIIPETKTADSFALRYKQENNGSEPEWFSYYAYDSVKALTAALKKTQETTRQDIWNAIPWLRFDGVTGTKTLDEKGNLYSAAYDLFYVYDESWKKFDTRHIFQPEDNQPAGAGKINARSSLPLSTSVDFTYTLTAADPLISHLAGEQYLNTGWKAESLDAPIGGVLMAYYEDIERGMSNNGEPFVFEDGQTYYLTFNLMRFNQSEDAPSEGDILEVSVKSVYRYQNGDDVTHFARLDLLNETIDFVDMPSEGSHQITIPVTYQSAVPEGVTLNNEDNRFHWELKLLNAAKQRVVLGSIEIGTNVPTSVDDYVLH